MAAGQRRDLRALLCLALERAAVLTGLAAGLSAAGLASGFDSDFDSPLVSGLAGSLLVSDLGSGSPCRMRLFSLSDLKSVSYQPEPLRRNTGAEISFFRPFLPQLGHFANGLSVIFCSTSSW